MSLARARRVRRMPLIRRPAEGIFRAAKAPPPAPGLPRAAAMEEGAAVRAFEMLLERLGRIEDAVARLAADRRDDRMAVDVRQAMMVPVTALLRPVSTHSRTYKICERLENVLHDNVDLSLDGPGLVRGAAALLGRLGTHRITYLMLCQISYLTDDLGAVLDLADDRDSVPPEDALAFYLYAEGNIVRQRYGDRGEKFSDRILSAVDGLRGHWGALGYSPGDPWYIWAY